MVIRIRCKSAFVTCSVYVCKYCTKTHADDVCDSDPRKKSTRKHGTREWSCNNRGSGDSVVVGVVERDCGG